MGGTFNLRSEQENEMKTKVFITPHRYVLVVAVLALSSLALAQHDMHNMSSSTALVQAVRAATAQYLNVNNATAAGYGPLYGCVSGSDHGAMGIHYVNTSLLNGTVNLATPPALIYEPQPNGEMKLVGVEYIADQATWLQTNTAPPVLDGQVFLLVGYPNRFAIPAFFELHVWAWRDNPQGSFVDWNDHVTCAND
jgi:hypothetical protein